jgi:hypothetical protein
MPIDAATEDFFRLRLDHMIDLRHSLAVLSSRMPWQQIEASVAHLFSGKVRAGKKLSGINLFGEQVQMSAVKSHAGRPPVLDAVGKDGTPDARTVVLLCAETNMQPIAPLDL